MPAFLGAGSATLSNLRRDSMSTPKSATGIVVIFFLLKDGECRSC